MILSLFGASGSQTFVVASLRTLLTQKDDVQVCSVMLCNYSVLQVAEGEKGRAAESLSSRLLRNTSVAPPVTLKVAVPQGTIQHKKGRQKVPICRVKKNATSL